MAHRIRYKCPQCGAKLEAPDTLGGQAGTCGKCGAATQVPESAPRRPKQRYPGLNRGWYLLGCLLALFIAGGSGAVAQTGVRQAYSEQVAVFSFSILYLALAAERLKNIGYSGWLALLALVPLANVWLYLVCLFDPPGRLAGRRPKL